MARMTNIAFEVAGEMYLRQTHALSARLLEG